MLQPSQFLALADAVLVIHAAFILFVVAGLVLVIVGGLVHWRWIRNIWFRIAHLAAIAFVILESWLGVACPLTMLELWLRRSAGQVLYEGDFIAFWLRRLFFFDAPGWLFTLGYSAFGLLVLLGWLLFPPRRVGKPAA